MSTLLPAPVPVSGRAVAKEMEAQEFWTNREAVPLLRQLRAAVNARDELNALLLGCKGDGRADDAPALQVMLDQLAAQGGGVLRLPRPPAGGFYRVASSLTLTGASDITITGDGLIQQDAAGYNLWTLTNCSRIQFNGCNMAGRAGTVSASPNSAIFATATVGAPTSGLYVRDCTFTGFRFEQLYATGMEDVEFSGCTCYGNSNSIKFTGVHRGRITGNTFRDPQTPAGYFTGCIICDSTNGHSYGVCEDITIAKNKILNWVCAESILAHAGKKLKIEGNLMDNVQVGISVVPYQLGDDLEDIAIANNTVVISSTPGADPPEGNAGITVQAGALHGGGFGTIDNVVVTGNTIRNANAVVGNTKLGAMGFLWVNNLTCTNNTIKDSNASGIILTDNVTNFVIANNTIDTVTPVAGNSYGILIDQSGNTGHVRGNVITGATTGIHCSASNPALFAYGNYIPASGVTNRSVGGVDFRFEGIGAYTAADTTPSVLGVEYMEIANAGAVSIAGFDDGLPGQRLHLVFSDAKTLIVHSATVRLSQNVDFPSADRSSLTLVCTSLGNWQEVTHAYADGTPPTVYTAGDTTPSVLRVDQLHITNGGAVTITDMDNAYDGQVMHLTFADANTTLSHGGSFLLFLGADFISAAGAGIILKRVGSSWRQIAPSVIAT